MATAPLCCPPCPGKTRRSIVDDIEESGEGRVPNARNDVVTYPWIFPELLAETGQQVGKIVWPSRPDGGAVVFTDACGGGFSYCVNSENPGPNGSCVSLLFPSAGCSGCTTKNAVPKVLGGRLLVEGTDRNCSGGATPEGLSYLSCEEAVRGLVWEVWPRGGRPAVARNELGRFKHEAAAFTDPDTVWLSEDERDGLLYRWTPAGGLEAAVVDFVAGTMAFAPIPDPNGTPTPTRYQLPPDQTTPFNGGEGLAFDPCAGLLYFATKGDNQIWVVDPLRNTVAVFLEGAVLGISGSSSVDNLCFIPETGDLLVCEDGPGEPGTGPRVFVVNPADKRWAVLAGLPNHTGSETAGAAVAFGGDLIFFNSQRGPDGSGQKGQTFGLGNVLGLRRKRSKCCCRYRK
jgi:hypothetical protein